MGQRASDTRGITFEDVVVPAEVRNYVVLWNPAVSLLDRQCFSIMFILLGRQNIVSIVSVILL